ncbi:head maturation protease, ClpP-related [uncultured Bacteroides sp.]|jgi:ATP-dependent protease ClpP protease subunit|uniref:head maturation protease, ClpP-related n=1 Tax=uncultured Bacteroides sp. TaxID=162156 RepID=UPI002053B768|nr:head maturation protease, ClpP-related [uncultured Bacteroides sp.]DAI68437.1 MAG TPA: Putative ATP dependent Clp protease [Caudoviricetes sp.]
MKKVFANEIPGNGTVSVLMYGNVGNGEKVDSERVVTELMELAAAYGKIDVHIHSKGGDVFSGIAIYNALRTVKADITIYIDGLAASIAGIIALCGKPLYMNKYARIMLHRVSGGSYGTADELRKAADVAEELENDLANMIATRCRMKPDDVRAKYFDGQEHWISAQEALAMGMIDGIIDTGESLSENATNTEVYNYFMNRLTEPQKTKDMDFINELKKRPSFANLANEDDMLRHITTMENQAAKVPALEAKITELTNQIAESKKTAHQAFLNQAVAEGKITKEQMPTFLNLMMADEANTRKAIEEMPKKGTVRVEDILHTGSPAAGTKDLENMSWDEIDKAERLAELKEQHPDLFKKKFNEKFGK